MIKTGVISQTSLFASKQIAKETKVQEQNRLQTNETKQVAERQDLSRNSSQIQTLASNVSYSIVNGKPAFVRNNSKTNNSGNKQQKGTGKNESADTIETKMTEPTYYSGYSLMANNSLSKRGLSISTSPIKKGIQAENTEKKSNSSEIQSFANTNNYSVKSDTNSAKYESIFWITQDIGPGYQAKIGINNQDNSLLAKVKGLYGHTAAIAYQETNKAMEDVVS